MTALGRPDPLTSGEELNLDRLVERFAAAWHAGRRPRVHDDLGEALERYGLPVREILADRTPPG